MAVPRARAKLRVLAPGGAHELVELRCETVEVDLDRGEISLFWRGRTRSSSGLAGLGDERLEVDGGFVLGASAAAIATALEGPPRSPLSAVPIAGDTIRGRDLPLAGLRVEGGARRRRERDLRARGGRRRAARGRAGAPLRRAPPRWRREPRLPGHFVPPKPRADVLVTGHAYPKADARVARVEVRVGPVVAGLVAMGPRAWLPGGHPGEPAPMDRIPLRWEQAFGGRASPRTPPEPASPPGRALPHRAGRHAPAQARGSRAARRTGAHRARRAPRTRSSAPSRETGSPRDGRRCPRISTPPSGTRRRPR